MVSEDKQQILDIKVKYEDAIYGIIRYKEKIDQLKQSIKDLQQQEKDKTITTNEMKLQTEAINATIKEYQYNVRALRKEIQNNVRTENEQEGSLKQLRAQLSNATKKYDEMAKAEREGAKGQEMQEHIQDLIEELKEAEEATGRFQRSVGSYYDSMMKAADDIQNTEFLGFDVVDDTGIGKVMEMGKSVEDLRVKFGALKNTALSLLTNPYFLAMAGVAGVGMAFKWFYDYNKGLMEATRLTQQFTGLTGDEMKSVRNEVLAVSNTFGLEFTETMQSANTMSKAFGISVSESLKIMQDGLVSGANANGEFLDTIKEYPRYFKEAGLSAEEMVAISTQATKEGIFSDKGVDTIKEGNLRLREMTTATAAALDGIGISSKQVQKDLQDGSKTTFQVMQEVANKLKELPQSSAAVGSAIANIFGGPGEDAGLAYIEMLSNIELDMDKVKAKSGDIAKAQEDELNATKELQDAMASLFDYTGGGFEKMKAQLSTIAKKSLTAVIKGVVKAINYFIDWYNESLLLRGIINALGTSYRLMWNAIKLVCNLAIDAFKRMGFAAKGMLDILEGIVTFDLSKAQKGFKEMFDISGTIKEAWHDIKNAGIEIGNSFADGFENTVNGRLQHIKLASVDGGATSSEPVSGNKGTTPAAKGSTAKTKAQRAKEKAEAKAEAERRKKQEKELQEQIALIQFQYNEQVMDAKKRYLAGMYDNERDYSNDLEQLEKDMVARSIDAYVAAGQIGAEKAQEMQAKLLDIMIKAKEDLKNQAKEIVDELNKEFENAEKARKDANIMNGGTGEEDDAAKLERYKAFLESKIQAYKDYTAVQEQLQKDLSDAEVKEQEEANKKKAALQEEQLKMMSDMIQTMGDGLSEFFESEDKSLHSFLKSMLTSILDAIEIAVNAYFAQILAKEIASKSWGGVASAAALMALIKAAFAGAKALVKGFSTGGYVQGSGTGTSDSIPARLSNGESVMTAKATSMFSPILSAFNQLGGGVPIVVNNGGSNIGMDMLAAAVARGYQMAPQPVVSVEEINRTQRRVQTIENIGRL
nr:MAG TPA: minor tail protein [Caudoviricetes sp.]